MWIDAETYRSLDIPQSERYSERMKTRSRSRKAEKRAQMKSRFYTVVFAGCRWAAEADVGVSAKFRVLFHRSLTRA